MIFEVAVVLWEWDGVLLGGRWGGGVRCFSGGRSGGGCSGGRLGRSSFVVVAGGNGRTLRAVQFGKRLLFKRGQRVVLLLGERRSLY